MRQREVTFLIVALLLAAVAGAVVGGIIAGFLPPGSVGWQIFSETRIFGLPTVLVDFWAVSVTFGLTLKINFMSVLFIILVIVYFRWWYL